VSLIYFYRYAVLTGLLKCCYYNCINFSKRL
jgi:hypothetical protein